MTLSLRLPLGYRRRTFVCVEISGKLKKQLIMVTFVQWLYNLIPLMTLCNTHRKPFVSHSCPQILVTGKISLLIWAVYLVAQWKSDRVMEYEVRVAAGSCVEQVITAAH